jgi:hypothetical protein
MKRIALGVLLAVTALSLAGCHWRYRRWRDHHYRSFNSSQPVDHLASNPRAAAAA